MTEETLERHRPLGARLRELRRAKGLSVAKAAAAVSRRASDLARMENGERGVAVWLLPKLASLYGADLAALEALRS